MDKTEMYKHIAEWRKYLRRHECNVFDALFYDKEDVTEEDVQSIVIKVAEFFNMPQPDMQSKCNTFAEVMMGDVADKCEISYNMEMLRKIGINNRDALTLCLVHEMTHQLLQTHRFMVFCSERWIHELAADMTAGLYAARYGLTTGKYKFALSIQKHCITHPCGELRKAIFEYGHHCQEYQMTDGDKIINQMKNMMPAFVLSHQKELQDDWYRMLEGIELSGQDSSHSQDNTDTFVVGGTYGNLIHSDFLSLVSDNKDYPKHTVMAFLKQYLSDNPDEFIDMVKETVTSKRFLSDYIASIADVLMNTSCQMASSMSYIKERLDIKGVITHKQRLESYTNLLENLKNYHKNPDPKIEAELDLVFNSIDPATWKMFFLKQSPKLQAKMNEYVNPKRLAEMSNMQLVVRKVKSIDVHCKNDGFYRLFLVREYESLMVHFSRKNGFILYLIYLLDRKLKGNKADTLDLSKYKKLFGKLYNKVYGINGESFFTEMMKNYNANNEVQQKGLYSALKSIRDDIGSTCDRMQEPAEPFILRDIASHLAVLPERIILPEEIMALA